VATGEGSIALHVPQTRDGLEPFQTRILEAYRRRSETLEALIPQLYVKGLSVRDVSDASSVPARFRSRTTIRLPMS
jgi:transposase-like protein